MHRSSWKFPFIVLNSWNKNFVVNQISRSIIISDFFYKQRVGVYNGKKIIFFSVKKAMSGKKFGEFAVTKVLGPQVINKKKKKR